MQILNLYAKKENPQQNLISLHGRQTQEGLWSPSSGLHYTYCACENASYLGHFLPFPAQLFEELFYSLL